LRSAGAKIYAPPTKELHPGRPVKMALPPQNTERDSPELL